MVVLPSATYRALETTKRELQPRRRVSNFEDTFRFYALRLHEGWMISKSPNALIAQGTDGEALKELESTS